MQNVSSGTKILDGVVGSMIGHYFINLKLGRKL
jgi:hypothetical protein